jgi:hypothetical protein
MRCNPCCLNHMILCPCQTVVMAFEQPAVPAAASRRTMPPFRNRGAARMSTPSAASHPHEFDAAARRLRVQGRSY